MSFNIFMLASLCWLGPAYGLAEPHYRSWLSIAALLHLLSAVRVVYLCMHAHDSHAGPVLAAHAP